jgi:molybdate transport system ATP-binding protein
MSGLQARLRQEGSIPLDIELNCERGELLALVGPSGSGKTTILRAMAGLYAPRESLVQADDEVWSDSARGLHLPTRRRRVGLVSQSYALFPHMTARANVEAALTHLPRQQRTPIADRLLALVNLAGLELRRSAELSGGQQQRVAVARALAREPRVLLLDEPFSAVDKMTRARLYQELAVIRTRLAMPIVLVTHDLDEALMLADTMQLIKRGRSLQRGRPIDVLLRPATVEAARLLGHRNIFPARVVEHRSSPPSTVLDWRGTRLEAAHQPQWAAGSEVAWLVPPSKVVLHRRDRPSRGETENPVTGAIERHAILGDNALSEIRLDGGERRRLTLQVPTHVSERNGLGTGVQVSMSILAGAIHVMPRSEPGAGRQ